MNGVILRDWPGSQEREAAAGTRERVRPPSTFHDSSMIRYYDRNRGGIERNATHAVAAFI